MLRTDPSRSQPAALRIMAADRNPIGSQLLPSVSKRDRRVKMARIPASSPAETAAVRSTVSSRSNSRKPSPRTDVVDRVNSTNPGVKIIAKAPAEAPAPGVQTAVKPRTMAPAAAGFILADEDGNPIYASLEAKAILTYPEGPRTFQPAWASLRKSIFPLPDRQNSPGSTSRVEIVSARRKYICLAISLDKPSGQRVVGGSVAIVLERCRDAFYAFSETWSQQFHLTEREQEVVEFLIRGLTNKEIAARMQISPNTVRAFVRMVMGKLGISTRSGIVGMVFRDIRNLNSWDSDLNRFQEA